MTTFLEGYLEAITFTDFYSDNPELSDKTTRDLSDSARMGAQTDCIEFQSKASELLERAYELDYSEFQAGVDFWFTRNGHGAGFWERDELYEGAIGDKLSDIAREFGEVWVYLGDDGLLYID